MSKEIKGLKTIIADDTHYGDCSRFWGSSVIEPKTRDQAEVEAIGAVSKKFEEIQRNFNNKIAEALFGGWEPDKHVITDEQRKRWAREDRIRKLKAPYYWLKTRIIGTYKVWTSGECGSCEHDDYYY